MSAPEPTDRDEAAAKRPRAATAAQGPDRPRDAEQAEQADSAVDAGVVGGVGGSGQDGTAVGAVGADDAARSSSSGESAERGERRGRAAADVLPSPVFVLLLGVSGLAGWFSWTRAEVDWTGDDSTAYLPFVFIVTAWVVSITLHEFGHAVLAYRFGDRSLRGSGYLRLNPFRFGELFANLVMPVVFLILGGIGLTGPATYLDPAATPGRARRSLIAAAGIAVNLILAAATAAAVAALVPAGMPTNNWMIGGLIYISYLNLAAALVNVLPIPGLDGFGVLAPYLPGAAAEKVRPWGLFGVIAVFAVLWAPPVNLAVPTLMTELFAAVGLRQMEIGFGEVLLRFWVS